MVTDIEKVACIDPSRVYAVGQSTGGGVAYYLACHAGDVFAAVAPAGFDLIQKTVYSWIVVFAKGTWRPPSAR